MIKVFQQQTEPGRGDCMSACLASILEMSIERVPNFRDGVAPGEFVERINEWLSRFALVLVRVQKRDADDVEIDFPFFPVSQRILCIAGGKSPRGDYGHSVVGEVAYGASFELLHDPHPDGGGITKLWTIDFLIPRDPAKTILRYQIEE